MQHFLILVNPRALNELLPKQFPLQCKIENKIWIKQAKDPRLVCEFLCVFLNVFFKKANKVEHSPKIE